MALRLGQSRLAAFLTQASVALSTSQQFISQAGHSVPAASIGGAAATQVRRLAVPALAENEDIAQQSSFAASAADEYPRRTGAIAVKVGMTQDWDQWGTRVPLTVLWLDDCQVTQVKIRSREGYTALQLGCGAKRNKQVSGTVIGHFNAAGVPVKRHVKEFRVSENGIVPVGTQITASHFVPGQYVDVAGTTIGKGFQGVMKKWGFAGGPATHGTSKAHRKGGSTGGCQDPGKVWPGKKMPGRMGGVRRTVQSAWVYKVDSDRNLLYIKGQVPGHKGNFVYVRDAVYKTADQQPPLPWPTALEPPEKLPEAASPNLQDPYTV